MTDRSIAPVIAGLSLGITFVIIFAVMVHDSSQSIQQPPVATELPQVKLVVLDGQHEQGLLYSGERGTYCWPNFGCADSEIIIPSKSIDVAKGSDIEFEFLDSYHNNKPPNELAVAAFNLHHDLKVNGATKGRVGGDIEITTFDFGGKPIPYLSDTGNHNYSLDLADGEYIIWAYSAWHLGENIGDGDVSYFYRISIGE